jgi:hypothetical protein
MKTVLLIILVAFPAFAQETRIEQLEQAKRAKTASLQPKEREKGDVIITKLEHIFMPTPPAISPPCRRLPARRWFPFRSRVHHAGDADGSLENGSCVVREQFQTRAHDAGIPAADRRALEHRRRREVERRSGSGLFWCEQLLVAPERNAIRPPLG